MVEPPLSPRTDGLPDDREIERRIAALERQLDRLRARRPIATWGLAAAIAVVFALQLLWGGGNPLARLPEMGSLDPERVRAGEVFRVLSSVFLHASLTHVAFNTMALVILGSFIEKVLSARRLLVLVLASAVGGNVASLVFHPVGQSVGASGGIWGLLGAGAVLGFRSGGVLHPALVPGVRRASAINLGLNVLVSFLPQVNMAAHFGGGAVGAVAIWSGALTGGLPRYRPGDDFERSAVVPRWIGPTALALVVASVLSLALAWNAGRPWRNPRSVEVVWSTVALDRVGVRVDAPTSLERRDEPDEGEVRFVRFGDLRRDALAVRIGTAARPVPEGTIAPGALADLERQLRTPPDGFVLETDPTTGVAPAGPYVVACWRRPEDDVRFEVAAMPQAALDVVVYVAYRGADTSRFDGTAERVVRSVEPL